MTLRKAKPKTIDEYLASVNADYRGALEKLRKAIHAAAPKAEECISYGIPAFRVNGRLLVWIRRMGKSLLILSDEFDDVEKISARCEEFPNQQRHALLCSGRTAAGKFCEEARSSANRRNSRLIERN
jgi:uncharacterized protein YdhG (YjbR/CyaY superfamily)